jgi:hypothetical protein
LFTDLTVKRENDINLKNIPMKTFFLFLSLFIIKTAEAQDTLFFFSGEFKVIQLLNVDVQSGILHYKIGDKEEIRNISSLKSYSNHFNLGNVNSINKIGSHEPENKNKSKSKSTVQDPSKYEYSKFSLGVNLFSPLSVAGYQFRRSISSNYNQSLFFQYNLNNKIGLRLPFRIGFGQLKDTNYFGNNGYFWQYNRELIFETGIEISIMQDDNQKITPYFMPGIYFGRNKGVIDNYDNLQSKSVFFPAPVRTYFRVALNGGFQFNFSKYVQINSEAGLNFNSVNTYYSLYSNGKLERYIGKQIGFQAAVNVVYRFGGKPRE